MQLCRPCESEGTPEIVRETWKMVDEYMLTEAEIALVKLLESLDKAALPHGHPAGASHCTIGHSGVSQADGQCQDSVSRHSIADGRVDSIEEALSQSHGSSSSSSNDSDGTHQAGSLVSADSQHIVFSSQHSDKPAEALGQQAWLATAHVKEAGTVQQEHDACVSPSGREEGTLHQTLPRFIGSNSALSAAAGPPAGSQEAYLAAGPQQPNKVSVMRQVLGCTIECTSTKLVMYPYCIVVHQSCMHSV